MLLVEAGGSDRLPIVAMPGALPFTYQNRRIQWGYQSGPEPELHGKVIDEKAGKILDGSSSINAMIFNRGNPMDYDGWAADGLTDWDYAHCLPYVRKTESFADGADPWRGCEGPMRVTRAAADHKLYEAFLHAGVEAGQEVTADHNGFRQEGMHIAQSLIADVVRWSESNAYLRPVMSRPNLQVRTHLVVRRVLVEAGEAVGVEGQTKAGTERFGARREVIVSAGALNSPRLLMLPGIGDPDELRESGIEVVATVPEVGKNLQNHPGVDVQFAADHEHSLTSQVGPLGRARLAADWVTRRKGLGTTNFSRRERSCARATTSTSRTCSTSSCRSPGSCAAPSSCRSPASSSGSTSRAPRAAARCRSTRHGRRGARSRSSTPTRRGRTWTTWWRSSSAGPGLTAEPRQVCTCRARSGTCRQDRRRDRRLDPDRHGHVLPPVRRVPDGRGRRGRRRRGSTGAGSAPPASSTLRSCPRSSPATSTHRS